jgi:hypothetical protein
MSDFFRETSHTGWVSRIGSSIKGVVVGGILILVCVVVLFWNEGRAVNEAKRIEEGQTACVSVGSDKVDPANEHKEIHISGDAATTEKPTDEVFGVWAPAIRLKRFVEMYQWKEKKETTTKKRIGGGEDKETTYTYSKVWDDDVNDSSEFKHPEDHRNPNRKPYDTTLIDAANVTVGAFKLSSRLIEMMEHFQPFPVTEQMIELPAGIKSDLKFDAGGLYLGANPSTPEVGDTRIKFQVVKPGPVSVIGQQIGSTFQPFHSAHGQTLILSEGIKTANEMFEAEKARNAMITWLLRLGGFVVMWIGFMMFVRPLKVVADVLPFAGELVGFASGIVMLLVAGTISFVTIGIAWLVYRPLLGITCLVLAGGLVFLIVKKKRAARGAFAVIPPVPNIPPPPIPR